MMGCYFSPYGNMGVRERYEFSDRLKRNPDLQRSVVSSFGKWQLVGGQGDPILIGQPVRKDETPMNNKNLPFDGATLEQIRKKIKMFN